MFCKSCGKILQLKEGNNPRICSCGFTNEVSELSFSQKIKKKEKVGKGVYKEPKSIGFTHECKKCGHNKCDFSDLGAFYSDESNVYLYKCKKCGHVERQADGTSNR